MDGNHVTERQEVEEDKKNAGQCKVLSAGALLPRERRLERTSQERDFAAGCLKD